MERLHKVLAHAGVASRRECERIIAEGRVSVNGRVVTDLGIKVDTSVDVVVFDGSRVRPETPIYFMLNKPKGFVCSNNPEGGKPRVVDIFTKISQRLFTVGRLDVDSEGLIVVTNDGELCNLLTHPRYEIPKTYSVTVRGYLEPAAMERIQKGVWLSDGRTSPARIRMVHRDRRCSNVEVTLAEGRYREVRRIFAQLGHPVSRLVRTSIGRLRLGQLKPGQYMRVRKETLLAATRQWTRPENAAGAGARSSGKASPP
ncbi:MAG: pseudouridine synthase [Planctomycetota bacterium]|nr:pseudouridine synthase [Planctomycetota bacterium]